MFELFKKNDDFIPSNIDVNINDNDYLRFRNIQEADDWGKDFYGKYGEKYKYIVKQLSEHEKEKGLSIGSSKKKILIKFQLTVLVGIVVMNIYK